MGMMISTLRICGLTAALFCLSVHTAYAADEHVTVSGKPAVRVATYKDVAHFYERFEKFPAAARDGISLHFAGELLPDHELPSKARLVIHSQQGDIPLFFGTDRDMHFPRTAPLIAENPSILQTELIGHNVRTELSLRVEVPQGDRFTGVQARHWLTQINACIRDLTGVILSWFMPDAHRLKIDLAPGARFEAVTDGHATMLARNEGKDPMTVMLRPQDYSEETIFRSTKPFVQVRVKIPGDAYLTFTPDK
ncbi:hypothetical protein AD940_12305 [Gluconobacter thailandicus]|nr:hypothetical protein AD940_12305 [Gluconobacter thailandicus]